MQAALVLAGCDLFQGDGIHKPMPLAELTATGANLNRHNAPGAPKRGNAL